MKNGGNGKPCILYVLCVSGMGRWNGSILFRNFSTGALKRLWLVGCQKNPSNKNKSKILIAICARVSQKNFRQNLGVVKGGLGVALCTD